MSKLHSACAGLAAAALGLVLAGPAVAGEQGFLSAVDVGGKRVVIDEKSYAVSSSTTLLDFDGSPVSLAGFPVPDMAPGKVPVEYQLEGGALTSLQAVELPD